MKNGSFKSAFDAIADTRQESVNMQLRAELMLNIISIVEANNWTQAQASIKCGITQPRINDLIKGKIDKFSLDALVNINAELGQSISLSYHPAQLA